MRNAAPSATPDPHGELVRLITALREIEQRLEDLTGGEVDAVADHEGRPFLLRRAHEQLQDIEVARQAAILNSLPAHIALLDTQGVIVSVNRAWQEFRTQDGRQLPASGVGADYLQVCDQACGEDPAEGRRVADGIRSVLSGAAKSFTSEYPCHSLAEERWFLLTVTPLGDIQPRGAIVMHVEISERKRSEFALQASEREQRQLARKLEQERSRLLAAQRVAKVGSWETDVATLNVTWSDEIHAIFGTDPQTFQPSHGTFLEFVHPDDRALVDEAFVRSLGQRGTFAIKHRLRLRDGTEKFAEERWQVDFDESGAPIRVIGTCQDISESERTSAALQEYKERLSLATRSAHLGIWDWDVAANVMVWDQKMRALYGIEEQEFGGSYESWRDGLHPEDRERVDSEIAAALGGGKEFGTDFRVIWPNGEIHAIKAFGTVKRADDGTPVRMTGVNWDITERKGIEARIGRLSRVHEIRSQINALIVRVGDRDELFRETCRIAVEQGGFRMSLIAMHDRASGHVLPVASAGKGEQLLADVRRLQSSSEIAPNTMITRAFKDQEPVVSNNSKNDVRLLLGGSYSEFGINSVAVLPLVVANESVGVLVLYSTVPDFFHDDEMRLLTELTADVAFAIDHIDNQQRLEYLAYYDSLTGLANRSLFIERANQCVRSAASAGEGVAMVLVDLERFKNINDSLGQPSGDELLRQVAAWLGERLVDSTLLGRVGSDHFAMMLPDAHTPGDAARELEKLIGEFHEHPFPLGGSMFRIAAKFGVSVFPDDGPDGESLFKHAEAALKKAKASGDRYLFYTQKMTETVARKLTLENQLRQALDNEEFVLHYQPKVNLRSGRLTSAEALIRWNDPRTGLVPPGMFIPILEETGLIYEVGRWALRKSLEDYLRWRNAGLFAVRIAVNVSPLQLRHPDFVAEVRRVIGIDPGAAEGLELEITESMIMADVAQSTASLQAIRDMDITIAIDDFGTGYSSLGYLSKLPVNTLKIDRSFIIEMTETPDGLSLVSTMISLAHSLNLKVVAEGVETEEQATLLRLLKCDEMQGYLVCKPIAGEDFEARYLGLSATN